MNEDIKKSVTETLLYCNQTEYPIDPFLIASRFGIKIHPYSILCNRGFELSKKRSKDAFSCEDNMGIWHIFYNDKNSNIYRQRFSLMHEIGHYVLGHVKIDGNEEEIEANNYARYSLVPYVFIYSFLGSNVSVESIQVTFQVSRTVAQYAYEKYKWWLENFQKGKIEDSEILLIENATLRKMVA